MNTDDDDGADRLDRWHAEQVIDLLPPERFEIVADFGCGDGRVLQHLTGVGYVALWGVDASGSMLDRLDGRLGDHVKKQQADGLDTLQLPNVDGWYTCAVFIHHDYATGAAILANMGSAVPPGGRILFDVPVYDEARERDTWTDVTVWDAGQLLEAAEGAGLTVTASWFNEGAFDYREPGPHHGWFHVLDKVRT